MIFRKVVYITIVNLIFASSLMSNCDTNIFNFSIKKNTKIINLIEKIGNDCKINVLVNDEITRKKLNLKLTNLTFDNLILEEVLDIILNEHNLSYELKNNILRISYLCTKIFSIDYILSQRKYHSTVIPRDSKNEEKAEGKIASELKITSTHQVEFWKKLDEEFKNILNRPHDEYKAEPPIINKNAGLITITATHKQLKRFRNYLKKLQKKVKLQVLIDMKLYTVTISEGQTTGVDWQQLYKLQNIDIDIFRGSGEVTDETNSYGLTNYAKIQSKTTLNEIVKFLKTQGDVESLSNPKILTLNNQPALISVGTEYFYKIIKLETYSNNGLINTRQGEEIKSIFAGVLLDITPEISENEKIVLKINPSLTETRKVITDSQRTSPPDLIKRQLASVITIKNGGRVILGGLISKRDIINEYKVPLLGDIPILGWFFKYETISKETKELVIIIEAHIINPEDDILSLDKLNYKTLAKDVK